MKIFGICLVKDESDIIEYCLQEATKWADKVFVYDNGSTDGTWELVQELSLKNPKVVPYKQEALPFRDHLRAKVFNHYRHLANDGDWWCFRLDSDEFYIDDPREFLAKIPKRYHVVCKASYDYRLTHEDIEELSFEDKCPHDALQLKYYEPLLYNEKRFFRHRTRLTWLDNEGVPRHMGIIYPKLIKQKHLQYRSPNQIKARLSKKKAATKSGYRFFKNHDNEENWQEVLEYRKRLIREDGTWRHQGLKYPDLYKRSVFTEAIVRLMHFLRIFP